MHAAENLRAILVAEIQATESKKLYYTPPPNSPTKSESIFTRRCRWNLRSKWLQARCSKDSLCRGWPLRTRVLFTVPDPSVIHVTAGMTRDVYCPHPERSLALALTPSFYCNYKLYHHGPGDALSRAQSTKSWLR